MRNKEFKEKLASLPSTPGVYLMKDGNGHVLYVGKARDLKKRVGSYFRDTGQKDLKTSLVIEKIDHFDTILTNTEKEALILESNLIKRHRPRYNVILKDDKRYPCLRLDVNRPYPNLTVVRKIEKDGALYFGPFPSAGAVRETLKVIHSTFKIRKCKSRTLKRRERPCLNYQMGLCLGPCSRPIAPEVYQAVVEEVIMFLKGRTPELIKDVRKQMGSAAARQDFEAAAAHRDRLFALERTLEKQVATTTDFKDRDVLGMARQGRAALMMVLFIRGGFLLGNRPFYFSEAIVSDAEMITSFVKQYYEGAPFVPEEVLLPTPPEDRALLEEWLSDLKGEKVRIMMPQRGEKARLVRMADQNAGKSLKEQLDAAMAEKALLDRLQRRLALERRPERIECFDLSNMAGTEGVGSMVVFEGGRPARAAYRKYRIKFAPGWDDYAMLREVLARRYKKVEAGQPLPDLLMVDGGKGQLNMAIAVLKALQLYGSFDLIGIAKKDPERGETEDKIYKPGRKNPVNLKKDTDVLLFLQRIRDEAHRSVITYHRKRRLMTCRRSVLEEIPGIGERRRTRLLKHFGSLKRIKAASVEELAAVPGMTRQAAQAVFETLKQGG
ncbi:MAG: excinuclease ABC subunit UvrC [Deltaproteobacteria bacterium]|nr:excinuclease ABC subunit UvrC [Deltaproteobacteria bacterium]MBW1795124.1 excinuclease ABC subunit UvrC [Deltaproteobacteria bacterium]MBW2330665.1 excinuclease ABC subunit UvrC [Deltaproteobacteria bacterium]